MAQIKKIKEELQIALNTMFDPELSDSDKLRLLIFAVRHAIYQLSK